jgi:hypothetical protein
METTLSLEGVKYTVVYNEDEYPKEMLRFGEPWITQDEMDNGHNQLALALLKVTDELGIAVDIITDSGGVDFEEVKQAYLEGE